MTFDEDLPDLAVELAAELLHEAIRQQRRSEKSQARQLARLMADPAGKAFTIALADQVFRPVSAYREAERLRDLINEYGIPEYLSPGARVAMRLGEIASWVSPDLVMPKVADRMRRESASVILPAEEEKLRRHLEKRRRDGIRLSREADRAR